MSKLQREVDKLQDDLCQLRAEMLVRTQVTARLEVREAVEVLMEHLGLEWKYRPGEWTLVLSPGVVWSD